MPPDSLGTPLLQADVSVVITGYPVRCLCFPITDRLAPPSTRQSHIHVCIETRKLKCCVNAFPGLRITGISDGFAMDA
ncbi:hypothetical protein OPQ81_009685 [Rhizoctonia solani]|nr:hypothetical protein OPQ81_009685 [Rhizoctonia solani]